MTLPLNTPSTSKGAETACLFLRRLGVDVFDSPTPTRMIHDVARRDGVTTQQIRGSRGSKALAATRQEIMWRLHIQHGIASTVIGRMLGGRDHTTVLHGVKAHARRIAEAASA